MRKQPINKRLAAMLVLGLGLGLLASLASADLADPPAQQVHPPNDHVRNFVGAAGAHAAFWLLSGFGLGAWLVAAAVGSLGMRMIRNEPAVPIWQWLAGWGLLVSSTCACLHAVAPSLAGGLVAGSGGFVGAWSMIWLSEQLTVAGCRLLIGSMALAGLVLSGETPRLWFLLRAGMVPVAWLGRVMMSAGRLAAEDNRSEMSLVPDTSPQVSEALMAEVQQSLAHDGPAVTVGGMSVEKELAEESGSDLATHRIDEESEVTPRQPVQVNPPSAIGCERQEVYDQLEAVSRDDDDEHDLPDLDVLDEPEEFPYALLAKKAQVAAITLEQSFCEFGLNVRVVAIDTGPVITQFELELEAGLRLSKVSRLADDLAIALRVPSVRVVAPIPGKNTVGIEVPNDRRVMVRLRE